MAVATEQGIGLELVQRKAALILYNELNNEIDVQQDKWEERDVEWNTLTGQHPDYVLVEHIKPDDYYSGHKPSLVSPDFPIDRFPNVSVMAYQAAPLVAETNVDQASNFTIRLDVEIFVKAQDEFECDARTHRTTEAVHQVMTRNNQLEGFSLGFDSDPNIVFTDIMKRKDTISHGDDWYWQGARMRYGLTRHNRLPFDIDQI